jgi:pyrroline-5-carboxylate reductase
MAPSLKDAQISFVGGGNMASAIIGGLLAKDIPKQNIYVAEPWDVNRDKMAALGVRTTANNVEASQDADIVIIAVKPQVAKVACTELAAAWGDRKNLPLVISIAAGITVSSYIEWFKDGSGRAPPIVRVMPNTPALVGEGASGLYATEAVSSDEKELATALLASVSGASEWVDKEELLDVVTGISGKTQPN